MFRTPVCSRFSSTKTKTTTLEPYDSDQLAREFLLQFSGQAFTVGQQLAFSFFVKNLFRLGVEESGRSSARMGNSGLKQHYETAKKTGVLKISQGKLTEFPAGFKQLENLLRTLDISENRFTTIPNDIGSFKLLKHLNVNQNRLTSIPDDLGNLNKLESLSLCSNRLTAIPQSLSQLVHLKQVYLSENQITQFPLMFCGLKHLDVLDISKNKISQIPDGVDDLRVTELNVNQNQISILSRNIANCPRLKTLRLEENCLQLSAIPREILTESKISVLAVDGNLFDMKSFAELDGYDLYMERYTAVKKKMF